MQIRYPRPLQPGDRIGVTAPSAGVAPRHWARLEFCVQWLRDRGFDVVVGDCIEATSHVSAPKQQRAHELQAMLTDPSIAAVIPPWGGAGTTHDLVDLLDYDAIAAAEPTWCVGFSDTSTWLLPLTLRTGMATIHGQNLMDTPYDSPAGILPWWQVAAGPSSFTQYSPGRYRTHFDPWETDPAITDFPLPKAGRWRMLRGGDRIEVSGRLIGGCIETVGLLAGTTYGDVRTFGRNFEGGLLVYVEAADEEAFTICRSLHAMRLAGWFDHANAILVGRTSAPASGGFTQQDAVLDAVGDLGVPVIMDMDFGHVPPYLCFVNGAVGHVVVGGDRQEITQTFR
ncbi:S66 family peptidase [Leekyejoonella antrihumi]|uniref:LD-carboxypeptidase n=1 Tax=Leekyejoonella antrihumi TaxID=1660198 RepID=A0A563DUF8_9MICO|nr:S66 peptidase family protein [Leekyejoonella antrihumi]TWP33324.1 LD-carboxypeptidase [Leekyejoonella antrihumi]